MRTGLAVGLALLGTAGCIFDPDIAGAGYRPCETDDACAPGLHCQHQLCAPPSWWDLSYQTRYQLLIRNPGDAPAPAGSLAELSVGEDGALSVEAAGFGPMIVHNDVASGRQRRAEALREPRGDRYAFVFRVPATIPPGETWGDLWLYAQGDPATDVRYSAASQVYDHVETFDDALRFEDEFNVEPADRVRLSGGQLLLRPASAIASTRTFERSVVSADLQLVESGCGDFAFGVGAASRPQSFSTPYAMFVADASGTIRHEIGSPRSVETVGEGFRADNFPHTLSVAAATDTVVFQVDHNVSATATASHVSEEPLHIHIWTRSCNLKVETLRVAAALSPPLAVRLGDPVTWYP